MATEQMIEATPAPEAAPGVLLTCLECGRQMALLKRHLDKAHGMTPAQYALRWDLTHEVALQSPFYAAHRAAVVGAPPSWGT